MAVEDKAAARLLWAGLVGSGLVALCCFTPALADLLGLVGLGAVVGYQDYVLLPALAGLLGLALSGLWRRNRNGGPPCCAGKEPGKS